MAYDEGLAERLRDVLRDQHTIVEKKMFGGLAFMVQGYMCVGVVRDELMVRVGAEAYQESLRLPHAREMTFTGKALKGFIYVAAEGFESDEDLLAWTRRALQFVQSLPPKI